MTPPTICPHCGGHMEYFRPDDPRQDDGTTETYFCEDCQHDETWYPETELTLEDFDDDFDDDEDEDDDGRFGPGVYHERYGDEDVP